MGWLFTTYDKHAPGGLRGFFQRQFGAHIEILDFAVVERRTAYLACRSASRPEAVWAAVVLLQWSRGTYNLGYKDLDETVGPVQDLCPERILKRLSPLPALSPEVAAEIAALEADLRALRGAGYLERCARLQALDPDRHARDWRARCQARVDAKKARPVLRVGDRVRFETPVQFGSFSADTFHVTRSARGGWRLAFAHGLAQGHVARIPYWRERPYQVLG